MGVISCMILILVGSKCRDVVGVKGITETFCMDTDGTTPSSKHTGKSLQYIYRAFYIYHNIYIYIHRYSSLHLVRGFPS